MANPRLPTPGQDNGTWGNILNEYLSVELNADGSLKNAIKSINTKTPTSGAVTLTASDVGAIAGLKQPTPPTSPVTNDLWYDTANDRWKRWSGTAWITTSGVTSVDGQAGDISLSSSYEPLGLSSATKNALGTNLIAALPNPFFIAHRCGRGVAPEETFEAADNALGIGVDGLDWDANILNDGALAMMHDDTVDRTTTGTGTVASMSSMQFGLLTIDAGTWFAPAWPNTIKAPLAGPVLDRYGRTTVLSVEAKTSACVAPLVAAIARRGLKGNVLINTSILADIATIKAAGITAVYYFPTTSIANLAAVVAAAPNMIVVQTGTTSADLATVIATGIPVIAGETDRQVDWATYLTAGVKGIVGNQPAYTFNKHTKRTTDSWSSKTVGHGAIPNVSVNGSFVTTPAGKAGIQMGVLNPIWTQLVGEVGPITAPSSVTIDLYITMESLPSDLTRYALISLADNDAQVNTVNILFNGYQLNVRADGSLWLYRGNKIGGTAVNLTSKSGAPVTAPTAGEERHIRLSITATAITATDVTTGATCTSADTTYRPGAWNLTIGKSDSSATGVWDFAGLTVTAS